MAKFKFIELSTKCCNGYIRYAYEGKEYVTETGVLSKRRRYKRNDSLCLSKWTEDEVKWTTVYLEWPFPESEQQGFVDMVNEQIKPACFANCVNRTKCSDTWVDEPPESDEWLTEDKEWQEIHNAITDAKAPDHEREDKMDEIEIIEIEELTGKINADPEDGKSYYLRGKLYEELGEYDRSLADCNKAEELGFDKHCIDTVRNWVYYHTNRPDLMIETPKIEINGTVMNNIINTDVTPKEPVEDEEDILTSEEIDRLLDIAIASFDEK